MAIKKLKKNLRDLAYEEMESPQEDWYIKN